VVQAQVICPTFEPDFLPAVFISDSLTAAIQRAPDRARRATLVAATLFGFIAAWAALFAIALHPSQAWWSDSAPLWVAGVATAAGVFAAVVAAIYGAAVFDRESQRDRDRDEVRRREQASQVAAWLSVTRYDHVDPPEFHHQLGVLNGSPLPVFEAVVHLIAPGGTTHVGWSLEVLEPGARVNSDGSAEGCATAMSVQRSVTPVIPQSFSALASRSVSRFRAVLLSLFALVLQPSILAPVVQPSL
jgi:hypothetical protein